MNVGFLLLLLPTDAGVFFSPHLLKCPSHASSKSSGGASAGKLGMVGRGDFLGLWRGWGSSKWNDEKWEEEGAKAKGLSPL